jgi:hypothetical protein
LQRACAACEEEEEEGILQRKETAGAAPRVAPEVGGPIDALRGGGEPLPARARAFFEPRFNYDFGVVRTHAGPGAADAARALNARAFTVGSDIAFASGQYRPDAPEGRRLLAHELAHVVQQGGGTEPLRLARLTEDEKQENLESSKYAGNERLEKAFDNDPPLKKGASGEAVRLVQEGLVADGFPMPVSTKPDGEMDGVFGDETFITIQRFQRKHKLEPDGDVGRNTMRKLDQLAKTGPGVDEGCRADAKAFEVTNETTFANPKFDPDFEDEDQRPALSTRATSAPFRWNASVKLKGKAQGCFEVGFLQTLRSSFQASVYDPQTGTKEKMCLVITPNPVRDAKGGVSEPWYMTPVRLGTGCFPGLVLPPGIGSNVDQTTAQMDDNPFLRWCIFVAADEQKTGTNCGQSDAAFRLSTVVETLAFDAWLVVRPVGSTDTNCFTFLRHATWVKSVEIVLGKTGSIGFLRRDLGVKIVELGDGIGPEKPSFGSDTAGSTSQRVCF